MLSEDAETLKAFMCVKKAVANKLDYHRDVNLYLQYLYFFIILQ